MKGPTLIVTVHQPQYLPWAGYFDKMDKADVFCYLDNVQFKKNEWQNRNRIKTVDGWQWITVPVQYRFPQKIYEVKINNAVNWRRKHLQALVTNYSKAPFFREYISIFEEVYSKQWDSFSKLSISLIEHIRKILNINQTSTVLASDYNLSDKPDDRLIDICKILGADTYLAGQGGVSYMNPDRFKERGIRVIFQDFRHPVYNQQFGDFQSHLSVADMLFNCGPETMTKIRQENQRQEKTS